MWERNSKVPEAVEKCLHDVISSNAIHHKDRPAVHAWDGDLTYGELDELSSRLSSQLVDHGVGPEVTVPLFFEKSMWTVVAVVGVLKAGGSFALVDMSLPKARLQAIIGRCQAKVVCSSEYHMELSSGMASQVEVVGPRSQLRWPQASEAKRASNPSWPMYVCFTSGSTGVPKGIVITHASFYTAFHHQAHLLGFSPECRTFDFASYSFDVAVHNVMTTLAIGGCLCIPSDADRKTNLNEAINQMQATIINLTATVSRLLRPEQLPTLKTILFLGEAVNLSDIKRFWDHFTVINTYGPAECTPISTINLHSKTPVAATGIGAGYGVLTWITNPDDHHQLVKDGEIGELLLEGHVLARGYLRDEEKTAAAFIENPEWLSRGSGLCAGREGRLYKTGDLVRLCEDGSLQFIGRKDTQVKIRGQRLELGEVESHVSNILPFAPQVVAEVILPGGVKEKAMLAVFFTSNDDEVDTERDTLDGSVSAVAAGIDLVQFSPNAAQQLRDSLPIYMVPGALFRMKSIPQTPSGKTDRKALREIGNNISAQELAQMRTSAEGEKRQPESAVEIQLQRVWCTVLELSSSDIGLDDSFFLLGGDSLAAMRLVAELRKVMLNISVAEIFEHPLLSDLARVIRAVDADAAEEWAVASFSLITDASGAVACGEAEATTRLRGQLADLCVGNVSATEIEDAFPSTPVQQGLLSLTEKSVGGNDYTLQAVLELAADVDIPRFKAAWEATAAALSILRTRLVYHEKYGSLQVIVTEQISWQDGNVLEDYLRIDKSKPMGTGNKLARFAIVDNKYFVWTVHHSLYDGWSLAIVLKTLSEAYRSSSPNGLSSVAPFNLFAKYVSDNHKNLASAETFWKAYFQDGEFTPFPALPRHVSQPKPNTFVETDLVISPRSDITMSTILRAAIAITLGQYTGSEDVVFGAILSGRSAPVPGIDSMAGPTIATVPLRAQPLRTSLVQDFLNQLQRDATDMMKFEQTSLKNITKFNSDCKMACDFQTLLVVQPEENDFKDDEVIGHWQISSLKEFTTYAITIECFLKANGMSVRAGYDSSIVSPAQMSIMLEHFTTMAQRLVNATPTQTIMDLGELTESDNERIWRWNSQIPARIDKCIHQLIHDQALSEPEAPAVTGWDGNFTYSQLEASASSLAHKLIKLGVGPETIVPLCFEKSTWAIVAMLGVLQAGGAFLPLNPSEAEDRRADILRQSNASIVLTSEKYRDIQLLPGCLTQVVDENSLKDSDSFGRESPLPCLETPKSPVYVIFTSGSTGQPKGVVLEHSAVATSCTYHGERFGFSQKTRMLQFASYTFDASIIEIITTLVFGGCVCVPSEKDRLGDISASMTSMAVNSALLTPTVARTLQQSSLPSLTTLIFGGEAVRDSDYAQWNSIPLLINAYGPTECAVTTVIGRYDATNTKPSSIGTAVGCAAWVVDKHDHNRLIAIGGVGELLLEGHVLARGYLNNAEKTAAVFIDSPSWLSRGCISKSINGRNARLYKTGDLVRFNDDGSISYVGRKDAQVKIRGQRLELGEVEYQLKACLANAGDVVADMAVPSSSTGEPMLSAFFTMNVSSSAKAPFQVLHTITPEVEVVQLTSDAETTIAQKLPSYMIPKIFLHISKMPLMPSGKANRKELRRILLSVPRENWSKIQSSAANGAIAEPETDVQRSMRAIWARILNLKLENIGIDSSFFQVGGDSIAAMQLSAAIRLSLGNVSTPDIMQKKTIRKLSEMLQTSTPIEAAPTSKDIRSPSTPSHQLFELSPIQNLYTKLEPDPRRCFDQHFFLQTNSRVSPSMFKSALRAVVARHPMLRSRFSQDKNGRWMQRVTDDVVHSVQVCHAGRQDKPLSPEQMALLIAHDRDMIDIENGPLTVALLIEGHGVQNIFIAVHHLVIDLVSWRIILQEIEQFLQDGKILAPPSQLTYQTWLKMQQQHSGQYLTGGDLASHKSHDSMSQLMSSYWQMDMSKNIEGATKTISFDLDHVTSRRLLGECNKSFATRPAELFIAGLISAFTTIFTDRAAPAVFMESHGREPWDPATDLSSIVGWFTAMYPVETDINSKTTLTDAVKRVKDSARSVRSNGWEYFTSRFANDSDAQRNVKNFPVEIMFNYEGSYQQLERSDALLRLANAPLDCAASSWQELTRFCLFEIACQTDHEQLKFSITYPSSFAQGEKVQSWAQAYGDMLRDLADQLSVDTVHWTLSDFPMAFKTYEDLQSFEQMSLTEFGISDLSNVEDIFPCSAMQQGILVSQGLNSNNYRTVLGISVKCKRQIDISEVQSAWRRVVLRHSLLRSTIVQNIPGSLETMQIILHSPEPAVSILDEAGWDVRQNNATVSYTSDGLQHHLSIYQKSDQQVWLDLEINHAIADGYSVYNVLLRDLRFALMNKLDTDGPLYSKFIEYVSKQSREEDLKFWAKHLERAEPCFISGTVNSSSVENETEAFIVNLESLDSAAIRDFARRSDITTATVIQVAWAMVLQMYTGQATPSFGMLVSGRDTPIPNVHDIFGPLINIIPCTVAFDETNTLDGTLQTTQSDYIESFQHQTIPLIEVHRALGVGTSGLFNSAISFQKGASQKAKSDSDWDLEYMYVKDQVEFDVSVAVDDQYNDDGSGKMSIELLFKAGYISRSQANLIAKSFTTSIRSIISAQGDHQLSKLNLLQSDDEQQLRQWNCAADIPLVERCIHDLIKEQAIANPLSQAVCSWDGDFTYQDLDLASSQLASHLTAAGVLPETVVPLCFEKSKWTIVAWLSVLKAGAAFILLDPSLPQARIDKICAIVEAKVAITSSANTSKLSTSVRSVVTLNEAFIRSISTSNNPLTATAVKPSSIAYIIFTSGSTGEPKGAIIEHQSYATAARHHGHVMRMSNQTRSLQFGSYNFAGAIMEMLMILIHGGCVCILSDEERSPRSLAMAITTRKANWAFLTSTVLAYLKPEDVPTMETICVGGEHIRSSQIKQWSTHVHLRQTYGSAETSAVVSSAGLNGTAANTEVGKPTTGRYWITHPKDSKQLVPIGVPGEILIEGATIAREYMGNREKTLSTFIAAPPWRVAFGPVAPASRFYRTGDLGVFRDDGSIELLGRRDTQIKLRGQRIEVGEIEYQARLATPQIKEAAVELAALGANSKGGPELIGFLVMENHDDPIASGPLIRTVQAKLEHSLPYFMVPALLIPIAKLPLTASGKTDRRRLRMMAAALSTDEVEALSRLTQGDIRKPTTEAELRMQMLWSEVLGVAKESIGLDDSFFRLGGDSVAAMRLVGAARKMNVTMTVADIFRQPTLAVQAQTLGESTQPLETLTIKPFDLLGLVGGQITEFCETVSLLFKDNTEASVVEDAYPCTPLQTALLSATMKGEGGDYMLQLKLELSDDIHLGLFKDAWDTVVEKTPTLRTRVVQHTQFGLVQVVCGQPIPWKESNLSLSQYIENDNQTAMDLGDNLLRLAIINDGHKRWALCTIHHAIYDGVSLPRILELVGSSYNGKIVEPSTPFNSFISHNVKFDDEACKGFWTKYLGGSGLAAFPILPPSINEPKPDKIVELAIGLRGSGKKFTLSTLVRGALGLTLAQATGSDDIVFGALVSGRDAPIPGIEDMLAPTIATVPIRVQVGKDTKVLQYLEGIQQDAITMFDFEHIGIRQLSKYGANAKNASEFQTLLEIQPNGDDSEAAETSVGSWLPVSDLKGFTNYALTLDCIVHKDKIVMRASVDTRVISSEAVTSLLARFEVAFCGLYSAPDDQILGDINVLTKLEQKMIWEWNSVRPEASKDCLHRRIKDWTVHSPNAPAVSAWDGELTYLELDKLSSRLAMHLVNLGVGPKTIVPLFFEKSVWTVVSVLAVLKAGGAFALLDMGLPENRLHSVIKQCRATVVCSSTKNQHLCTLPTTEVQIIDAQSAKTWPGLQTIEDGILPPYRSDLPLYICFTSGSTGNPKGIVITHEGFATTLDAQYEVLGFNNKSRVFDFASYSFDVAAHNVMTTLATGGCLCIPSDDERKDNINAAIQKSRATLVNLTATVARLLKPDLLPDLETLLLLGEAVAVADLEDLWGKGNLTIINTYGPAECTPISTINLTATTPTEATGIGKGFGIVTWVVDPDDHEKLVPVGVVGELLLEGPALALGYLGDAEKTSKAFIQNPQWLLEGAHGYAGRQGRLYKTGDLVKYNLDGSLSFVGRKDTQVKIRGQRLELGEIEHHVRECMASTGHFPVVADVITPGGTKDRAMLAVFIVMDEDSDSSSTSGSTTGSSSGHSSNASTLFESLSSVSDVLELVALNSSVVQELSERLPSYMIPSVYFRVPSFPLTPSGKTDRKRLRELGSAMSTEQLAKMRSTKSDNTEKRQPTTANEILFRDIWSAVLSIDADSIGLDDNFFSLGGDSVIAIQLVAEARKHDISLTVGDIFRNPVLHELFKTTQSASDNDDYTDVAPFDLLTTPNQPSDLKTDFAKLCSVDPSIIEDGYPCTPLQEGLMSLTERTTDGYIMHARLNVSPTTNIKALMAAWEDVFTSIPILRTRIVQHSDFGLVQVVLRSSIEWIVVDDIHKYTAEMDRMPMGLGSSLCRFGLIQNNTGVVTQLLLTIHHALYDGNSIALLLNHVSSAYQSRAKDDNAYQLATPMFNRFIKHTVARKIGSQEFWASYLSDVEAIPFPLVHSQTATLPSYLSQEYGLRLPTKPKQQFTMSTIIRGALGLLISRHTAVNDAVFGAVLSGRNASLNDVDTLVAPTIATVPLRVRFDKHATIEEYLYMIQNDATSMIDYEQTGLQGIAKINDETHTASDFHTLLVVQPDDDLEDADEDLGSWDLMANTTAFASYPLMLECFLHKTGETVRCKATFDTNVISSEFMGILLKQLSLFVEQLIEGQPDQQLATLNCTTVDELDVIWDWNKSIPELQSDCTHHIISRQAKLYPEASAICGFDGDYSYQELDDMSSRLALLLVRNGLEDGTIVPICFEKSSTTIIAMLAINKANCSFVPLNPADGSHRHEYLIRETKATIVLHSPTTESQLSTITASLGCSSMCITQDFISQLPLTDDTLPVSTGESGIYILFTSGSTGTPKGVVLKHKSVVTSCYNHGERFGFNEYSRVLQFSSYTFDAAISEIFATLMHGGCVCIPSEQDRLSNLAFAISSMDVNTTMITPTVARMLDPNSVPSLHTLILCGEAVSTADYQKWLALPRLINGYGPTECSIYAVTATYEEVSAHHGCIGLGVGCSTWVVNPDNHQQLAPLGAIGELLIEGHTVSEGYLNSPEKTNSVFIKNPEWLRTGHGQHVGRQSTLYKTGDLVRFNLDGTLSFISRKDTQVKIRGQRLELSEVEHQTLAVIQNAEQALAEVIYPGNEKSRAMLAVFLTFKKLGQTFDDRFTSGTRLADGIHHVCPKKNVTHQLSERLPGYMVPSIYFLVDSMPLSSSGKVNRKYLRSVGAQISAQELANMQRETSTGSIEPPKTPEEKRLQLLWASVLNVDRGLVSRQDNFFRLGGDSIAAMKLVSLARAQNDALTVGQVFQAPTLSAQAAILRGVSEDEQAEEILPFSIVDVGTPDDLARFCSLSPAEILDAYPCTAMQEGLLSLSSKTSGDYTLQAVLELCDTLDVSQFKAAWQQTVESHAILRTKIIQHDQLGLLQIVHNKPIRWGESRSLSEYLTKDNDLPMSIDDDLCRFALIRSEKSEKSTYFVLTIHHALYDGWSLSTMLQDVERLYSGNLHTSPRPQYNAFIKHVWQNHHESNAYWREYLYGGDFTIFPATPSVVTERSMRSFTQDVPFSQDTGSETTVATLIRGALALLISQYSNKADDVVFGATVSGRNAPVANITDIVGPTIATVPIRIRPIQHQNVAEYLSLIQQQAVEMESEAHEQAGLHNIANINTACRNACGFQTLLVIQPRENDFEDDNSLGKWISDKNQDKEFAFSTYNLTLECFMKASTISIRATFDERTIESWQVKFAIDRLGEILQKLSDAPSTTVLADLDNLSANEATKLWDWNRTVPLPASQTIVDIISQQVTQQPQACAVSAWDGTMTYNELDELSSLLAQHLEILGVGPETIVPICFEKSMWVIVAMLAVIKAGGAFVALGVNDAPDRRLHLLHETKARVVLTSRACKNIKLSERCMSVVVDRTLISQLRNAYMGAHYSSLAQASSPMYLIFTSGSTGKPKGVVLEHSAVALSCLSHGSVYEFSNETKILQFSSYSFDASIVEIFTVLAFGGRVCIPSEDDRMSDLIGTIQRFDINTLQITPTVARTIQPLAVPTVNTIILCGEAVTHDDYLQWKELPHVMNGYGPTEAAICSTIQVLSGGRGSLDSIGHAVGCTTWVVEEDNTDCLAALGTIGELLIEGNTLARGYLNDIEKTRAAFIEAPSWLLAGYDGHKGRESRLYKTGDLVRYNDDGSLSYIGRKDNQAKIRGQRLELGEIEHYVRDAADGLREVAAEVIVPGDEKDRAMVAVFFTTEQEMELKWNSIEVDNGVELVSPPHDLTVALSQHLPSYMIPTVYFHLSELPLMVSGKTDRKKLRSIGSGMTHAQIAELALKSEVNVEKRPAQTHNEVVLRGLWAKVLGTEETRLGLDDSFFRVGGDSITAMRLAGLARNAGFSLTVKEIFGEPVLELQAKIMTVVSDVAPISAPLLPFELIKSSQRNEIVDIITAQAKPYKIQDIYPATAFQKDTIQHNLDTNNQGHHYFFFDLGTGIDKDRLFSSFQATVDRFAMLRMLFMSVKDNLWQVIVEEMNIAPIFLRADTDMNAAFKLMCENDIAQGFHMGEPLTAFMLIRDKSDNYRMVMRLSHTQYDGVSFPIMVQTLMDSYNNSKPPSMKEFSLYLQHAANNMESGLSHWKNLLHDAQPTVLPMLLSIPDTHAPPSKIFLEQSISINTPLPENITMATVTNAAWSVVLSSLVGRQDVIYGSLSTGRNSNLRGIEEVVGPCNNILPIRATLGDQMTPMQLFAMLQTQVLASSEADFVGLEDIVKECTSWPVATRLDSIIKHQGIDENYQFGFGGNTIGAGYFDNPHDIPASHLGIFTYPTADGVKIQVHSNTHVVSSTNAAMLLRCMSLAVPTLLAGKDESLSLCLDQIASLMAKQ